VAHFNCSLLLFIDVLNEGNLVNCFEPYPLELLYRLLVINYGRFPEGEEDQLVNLVLRNFLTCRDNEVPLSVVNVFFYPLSENKLSGLPVSIFLD